MLTASGILLIAIETACITYHIRKAGFGIFVYYTLISNFLAALSTLLLLTFGPGPLTAAFRYLSVCMMTMTFLVVVLVLVPMSGDVKGELFSSTQFFYHLLCPVLTFVSYILWEPHSRAWQLPVAVTLGYGLVMMYLNYKGRIEGPYPFLKVKEQGLPKTLLWIAAMLALIGGIAFGVMKLAG